ncbi:sigma-70 family RNA polymerase sigma factor [Solirubrobacter ginsenosidimutans]|uniref:Sigma-70 family RNA polymerase sigma factor n=1 Tax=Solirubrobacter ginsenosidimutans TaxID=490573 RepID=A0A9X3N238_9ACTN|nr:sigma-70 family RNA polymerase sigma factor [Solirubrobacter ginsenosidimutans]MDA0167089.1 sigma-70 family RNA polymerase sigma factor [Solirubrobacter ginsenosidimutans]
MLQHSHHDRNYIKALEAERPRPHDSHALAGMVAAAGRGDQSAWTALIARFRGHVQRVARAHGLNTHQADDVAQETWLRLYRNLERVRDPLALGAWVDTTARREALRALNDRRRESLTDQDIGTEAVADDDPADELLEERRAALAREVALLPPRQRELIASLMSEPALSYAEISARLGMPVGSIGPTRQRCVERLREELAPGAR